LDLRKIGLGTTLQPSEFFKLGYIIFVAGWLVRKQFMIKTPEFFIAFAVLNFCLLFVFLLIPDLGTVLVLSIVGIIMAWYAGVQIKRILVIGLIGGVL
jgi:cell division protein FtsW (lipid II flippase)